MSDESYARTDAGTMLSLCTGTCAGPFLPIGEVKGITIPSIIQRAVDVSKLDSAGWKLNISSNFREMGDMTLSVHWVNNNAHATQHKILHDAVIGDGGSALFFQLQLPLNIDGGSAPNVTFKAIVTEFGFPAIDATDPKDLVSDITLVPTGTPAFVNF
jgi:hypothetical protein